MAAKQTPEQKREEALGIVGVVSSLLSDVEQFPGDMAEAKRQLALVGLGSALASPMGKGLTQEQFTAAVLVGRGMTYGDAAKALGVDEGRLHFWRRSVPGFRSELSHWREALEEDIEARLYSAVAEMAVNQEEMNATDRIRFLALMQKIASRPEDRARFMAELSIKQEQVRIQREQMKAAGEEKMDPRVVAAIEHATADLYEGEMLDVDDGDQL